MSGMDKMALWKEQDPGRIGDVLVAVSLGHIYAVKTQWELNTLLHHVGPRRLSVPQASCQHVAGYRHHPPLPNQFPQV